MGKKIDIPSNLDRCSQRKTTRFSRMWEQKKTQLSNHSYLPAFIVSDFISPHKTAHPKYKTHNSKLQGVNNRNCQKLKARNKLKN